MKSFFRLTFRRAVLAALAGGMSLWAIAGAAAGTSPFAENLVKEKPVAGARILRHK